MHGELHSHHHYVMCWFSVWPAQLEETPQSGQQTIQTNNKSAEAKLVTRTILLADIYHRWLVFDSDHTARCHPLFNRACLYQSVQILSGNPNCKAGLSLFFIVKGNLNICQPTRPSTDFSGLSEQTPEIFFSICGLGRGTGLSQPTWDPKTTSSTSILYLDQLSQVTEVIMCLRMHSSGGQRERPDSMAWGEDNGFFFGLLPTNHGPACVL